MRLPFEPIDTANYQLSVNEDLSERENVFILKIKLNKMNYFIKMLQHRIMSTVIHSDNDLACYQAIRSSERLLNASDVVFGSFHQMMSVFSEQSRGYQCTPNALCIHVLSYSLFLDVNDSLILDKVLCE